MPKFGTPAAEVKETSVVATEATTESNSQVTEETTTTEKTEGSEPVPGKPAFHDLSSKFNAEDGTSIEVTHDRLPIHVVPKRFVLLDKNDQPITESDDEDGLRNVANMLNRFVVS